MPRTILVFFGPPGSGKGTQSDLLSETTNWPAISTGELLRHEQKIGPAVGRKVKNLMSQGGMVSASLVDHLLKTRLAKPDAKKGFILDGYPRNEYQFRNLLKLIKGDDRLYFIDFRVPDREVMTRLSGRRVCDCGASYHIMYNPPKKAGKCDLCGQTLRQRSDDRPVVIRRRLKESSRCSRRRAAAVRLSSSTASAPSSPSTASCSTISSASDCSRSERNKHETAHQDKSGNRPYPRRRP